MRLRKDKILGATQYTLKILRVRVLIINLAKKWGWFRLFGRGVKWKHEEQGLMFSERNGYTKYLKIGKWVIAILKKVK